MQSTKLKINSISARTLNLLGIRFVNIGENKVLANIFKLNCYMQ